MSLRANSDRTGTPNIGGDSILNQPPYEVDYVWLMLCRHDNLRDMAIKDSPAGKIRCGPAADSVSMSRSEISGRRRD